MWGAKYTPLLTNMVQIYRKEGWKLNNNDKIVNAILKRCENNNGLCPCFHNTEDYEGKDLQIIRLKIIANVDYM